MRESDQYACQIAGESIGRSVRAVVNNAWSKLNRLAWTVRYLKARQIRGQLRHRVLRSFERDKHADGQAVTECPGCVWPRDVCFLTPGIQENRADMIHSGILRFLNCEQSVGFPPRWDCPESPKLWQYNLHYLEWLWALEYDDARSVVLHWIENHPLAKGAVGWDPYPVSLRLMNWCAIFWGRFRGRLEADREFLNRLWSSVARQANWLTRRLETHLLGNHYLENGAALAFIGSCFRGEQARRWFAKGYAILREQIPEQILPDGMHFERSPMYHCRMAYVLGMLMATGNKHLKQLAGQPLERMLVALRVLCHPDGQIALLNDSAFGICNDPEDLHSFCGEVTDASLQSQTGGCFALPDAGYYGWKDREGNYVVCDFGKIGPEYMCGHAHADMFNVELSLQGHRVVVDAGVYDYTVSELRRYCRSTAAHNTVEVDGRDQCEMWGAFRVARRGHPHGVWFRPSRGGFDMGGWHDAYRRLRGRPIHHRRIHWTVSDGLAVQDWITASRVVHAISRVHLHPQCSVVRHSDQAITVAFPGGMFQIVAADSNSLSLEAGWYCSEFGRRHAGNAVCISGRGREIHLGYRLICVAKNEIPHRDGAHDTFGVPPVPQMARTV